LFEIELRLKITKKKTKRKLQKERQTTSQSVGQAERNGIDGIDRYPVSIKKRARRRHSLISARPPTQHSSSQHSTITIYQN
jgi:hypothetical protein